jgi:hypothetical protein
MASSTATAHQRATATHVRLVDRQVPPSPLSILGVFIEWTFCSIRQGPTCASYLATGPDVALCWLDHAAGRAEPGASGR